MYFEVYVVATELRGKVLATVALRFSGFFLDCRSTKKIATKQQQRGLNMVKSPIGTRDHLVAATCGHSAARRREGKAKI
jgi:hypothetical protein